MYPKFFANQLLETQLNFTHFKKQRPVAIVTCILPSTPELSILLETLTVSPQISYWGFLAPMTPATTGPWFIPRNTEICCYNH